ncbi:flagellar hook-associated protein FlgK [Aciditerrimonas ferrireducens]|uniref:flagellar hook-associated protein FlgK n=1 Tax=Aciditerrimonas ferrireducens TaxID=667306 RepID=UPI00200404B7|nr:flagellar hook-associated protein FlgK [Aciditerrimonas ferrireducens]MCK4177598.1 flagellar hook-associated protein FlgK [Aciditerrimonas ferrireducens]
MSNLSLEIAASALAAQQTGMDTVSENLANATTPGYVAETPNLTTMPVPGPNGVGSGVEVLGISQVPAQLAQTVDNQAQANLAQATARQQVLQQIQSLFPEPNGSGAISSQLASFWNAWDAIDQNPTSPAPYTQVVEQAQGLATTFNQTAQELAQAGADASSRLSSLVAQDNTLLAQVAQLNGQIVTVASSGASPNALVDQRNQVVSQLAKDLGVQATDQPNGTVTLAVGGITLVQDTTATSLAVQQSVALSSVGGSAGGLLQSLNSDLPGIQQQLDATAQDLASAVDGLLSQGYTTTTGMAGDPLFVLAGTSGPNATTTGITAATLSVNPTVVADPQGTLAVSSVGGSGTSANGANAQAIAEAGSAQTGPISYTPAGSTSLKTAGNPNADYNTLIQQIGSTVQQQNATVQTATSVATAAQQNLEEIAGVNTSQQLIAMLSYQHAYQASADVVNSANQMLQSLIQAV